MSSNKLTSLPETNMKSEIFGNVTSLKIKNGNRTQPRQTRSAIYRSLIFGSGISWGREGSVAVWLSAGL